MKACKGLILFCFLISGVSSCFDPPEFTSQPEIQYEKIQFKETPSAGVVDTLILFLNFKDGDGDLGLGHTGTIDPYVEAQYTSDPYQSSIFFLADGTGDTLRASTTVVFGIDRSYNLLKLTPGSSGKLATDKTRMLPDYGHLPVYDPDACVNYLLTKVLVAEADNVVDATYNITDTLVNPFDLTERYFLVEEAFLYKRNINNYNIDVEFFMFENGGYVEYDWFDEFCMDFNGRFPILTNGTGAPLEGTIRYSMENSSFIGIFGSKKLKLKIRIRDRALNTSKEIETPDFDLRSIQVN